MDVVTEEAESRGDPRAYHERRQGELRAIANALTARSDRISSFRGVTFLLAAGGALAVVLARIDPVAWVPVGLFGAAFVALVVRHALLVTEADQVAARLRIVDAAIARIDLDFALIPEESLAAPKGHAYAGDLDLFGQASLVRIVSTARTAPGIKRVGDWLLAKAAPDVVQGRQVAARELAQRRAFREELERLAARANTSRLEKDPLVAWIEARPQGTPLHQNPLARFGRALAPITAAAFVASQIAPERLGSFRYAWAVLFTVQIVLLLALRPAVESALALMRLRDTPFSTYLELVRLLERERFEAPLLVQARAVITDEVGSASGRLGRLARTLSFAELRHNPLLHFFVNPLVLWDVFVAVSLERWRVESGPRVAAWIDAIAEFEALASLGAFAHDHPEFAFPELVEGAASFTAEGLAHPLLPAARRVANDVALGGGGPAALLVTGSNMSGKSTLLRAIGVNTVLALAGAPCCAKRLALTPLDLATSMRVTDSLHEGVSHFYAELARLKSIVDLIDGGASVLFLLDEVMHGTNSRERQIGAKALALHLCGAGAIGAITSHDVGLAELEAESGGRIVGVHFEEQVEGSEMTFDYRLRPGVVRSGNALRLMRALGLPVGD